MSKGKQTANPTSTETALETIPTNGTPETPAKETPAKEVQSADDKELAELMLKRAVFETDAKTVMLDAISLGDKCLPFLSSVVPSKKFKASSMGKVFDTTKELAAKGKLSHLLTLAAGTKGKSEGAKKLLGMLEAREKLNNGAGEKLLELMPVNQD